MSEQETSDEQSQDPQQDHRAYLVRAAETMSAAQDIIQVERATLMQAMGLTSLRMDDPDLTDQQSENLSEHMEYLMVMLGQYSIALNVTRTIGEAALQGLANTGIRVPEAAPILGPDGEVLAKPRKPRRK